VLLRPATENHPPTIKPPESAKLYSIAGAKEKLFEEGEPIGKGAPFTSVPARPPAKLARPDMVKTKSNAKPSFV